MPVHTEKSFRNRIKSNRNHIVFSIFRLIWNQMDVRLVRNQSENSEYNLTLVQLSMISKKNSLHVWKIYNIYSRAGFRE